MKKFAIRGHATRGREVIELLEMLGGKNENHYSGEFLNRIYFINKNGYIESCSYDSVHHLDKKQYTLEEFLNRNPYKIDDEVLIARNGRPYIARINAMRWSDSLGKVLYQVGDIPNVKAVDMCPISHGEQSKEKDMKETEWVNEIDCPDGYEFRDEQGNVSMPRRLC